MKEDKITMEGEVIQAMPNALFQVKLANGLDILCHISGKIRKFNIRVLPGDRVDVELSSYDLTKGRITYRYTS